MLNSNVFFLFTKNIFNNSRADSKMPPILDLNFVAKSPAAEKQRSASTEDGRIDPIQDSTVFRISTSEFDRKKLSARLMAPKDELSANSEGD